jgi:hypothetical protein
LPVLARAATLAPEPEGSAEPDASRPALEVAAQAPPPSVMNSASDAMTNAADGLGNLDMVNPPGGLEFLCGEAEWLS